MSYARIYRGRYIDMYVRVCACVHMQQIIGVGQLPRQIVPCTSGDPKSFLGIFRWRLTWKAQRIRYPQET